MKRSSLLVRGAFVFVFAASSLSAAEPEAADKPANPTAYTALRAIQKSLGDKSLERIVEVTGREGVPQPYVWHVILREPEGLREVQVVGGKVSSQRSTPTKAPSSGGGPLRLQELNLDSSGAFDAADAQARKVRLRFDSVSYNLRIVEGRPEWVLELFDQGGGSLGRMRLAANNGTTASVEGRLATVPPPSVADNPRSTTTTIPINPPVVERRPLPTPPLVPPANTTVTTTTVEPEGRIVVTDEEENDPDIGFFTRAGRTIDHTNHTVARTVVQTNDTVKRSFKRTGATIQRFFTGRSDADQENPPPPPQ